MDLIRDIVEITKQQASNGCIRGDQRVACKSERGIGNLGLEKEKPKKEGQVRGKIISILISLISESHIHLSHALHYPRKT